MITIENFIELTNSAQDQHEVFRAYKEAIKKLGFDSICYCLVTDHPSLNLEAHHGVMHNYSSDWMSYYLEKKYDKIDPVIEHCRSNATAFSWDWIVDYKEIEQDQRKLMLEAREANLLGGVGIPIHGVNGEFTAIGLASVSGGSDLSANALSVLTVLSNQFHFAYADKTHLKATFPKIKLTAREREVLLWAAEGKSDCVIAEILGISYPTVRFHLKNSFVKLDANERTFAICKAIHYGLITPNSVY